MFKSFKEAWASAVTRANLTGEKRIVMRSELGGFDTVVPTMTDLYWPIQLLAIAYPAPASLL